MYNVYFEVAAVGFIVLLLLYLIIEYPKDSVSNRRFRQMVFILLMSDILDVVTALLIDHGANVPVPLNILANTVYFLISAAMGLYFFLYLSSFVDPGHKTVSYRLCVAIYLAYTVLMIGNIFFGYIFYFDETGRYRHGPVYPVCYLALVIMCTIGFIYLIRNRRLFELRQRTAFWLFLLLLATGTMLQVFFFPSTLLAMYFASLATMIFLFVIETPDFQKLEQTMTELEKARQEADSANEAKSLFLAKMSHEIRTPINAVIGMNEMILREGKDESIRSYALDSQRAAEALLSTINDILDLSKVESGKMEILPEVYDVSSLFHDVISMISMKAKDKGLSVSLFIDENLPSRLYGDDIRLRQILLNLLNNAVKYTETGTVSLQVSFTKDGGDAMLQITVEDTGIGIKEEDLSKLFSEYERIEEGRNRRIEGTGLGMNITKQILSLMGSTLSVESVYGEGSRFSFTLSQGIADETPVGDLEERIAAQAKSYAYAAAFTAPEAKILLVDDNATNRKVCRALLKETRVQIDEAAGGYECIECVKEQHYDLILLDHMMPDLDGIETLRQIKAAGGYRCAGTPVVALTANAVSGAKELYEAAGFDGFLSKPVRPEKLEGMLAALLPGELVRRGAADLSAEADVTEVSEMAPDIVSEVSGDAPVPEKSVVFSADEPALPEVEDCDFSYALRNLKTVELLRETVLGFVAMSEAEAERLQGFYQTFARARAFQTEELSLFSEEADEALRQYRVCVHAMKNDAAMIGALTVSSLAKLLEHAARDEKTEVITRLHEIFLSEWRALSARLTEAFSFAEEELREVREELEELVY